MHIEGVCVCVCVWAHAFTVWTLTDPFWFSHTAYNNTLSTLLHIVSMVTQRLLNALLTVIVSGNSGLNTIYQLFKCQQVEVYLTCVIHACAHSHTHAHTYTHTCMRVHRMIVLKKLSLLWRRNFRMREMGVSS